MSFLRSLFGKQKNLPSRPEGFIKGPGMFGVDVVGESFYQGNLEAICGKRTKEGENRLVTAALVLEDENPQDNQAVRVDVNNRTVGYLSRNEAREYRQELQKNKFGKVTLTCRAMIVGGWKRGDDIGHYGVKLDIPR